MGESHVRLFAAEGARVVCSDVRDELGKRLAAELGDDVCRYVHLDVTNEQEWADAVAVTVRAFGQLDVLVNNAGILTFAPIADMPLADFKRVLEVNAVGCWLGMKSVIGPMTSAGGGSIVNISSIEGMSGAADLSAYSASKFAIRGMTKSAARELGPLGIRVNSVHPGAVLTPMVLEAAKSNARTAEEVLAFLKAIPLARFGDPIEVSRLVGYLASDEASYCSGAEFLADGGILSGPGY
jgi:3alpha(or 20beta)-hydroxysteroid dehydrogenase